jgi:hypothetical protein
LYFSGSWGAACGAGIPPILHMKRLEQFLLKGLQLGNAVSMAKEAWKRTNIKAENCLNINL